MLKRGRQVGKRADGTATKERLALDDAERKQMKAEVRAVMSVTMSNRPEESNHSVLQPANISALRTC